MCVCGSVHICVCICLLKDSCIEIPVRSRSVSSLALSLLIYCYPRNAKKWSTNGDDAEALRLVPNEIRARLHRAIAGIVSYISCAYFPQRGARGIRRKSGGGEGRRNSEVEGFAAPCRPDARRLSSTHYHPLLPSQAHSFTGVTFHLLNAIFLTGSFQQKEISTFNIPS